jgi:uncharacterized membrane protein YqiK
MEQHNHPVINRSGAGAGVTMVIVALVFIVGPIAASEWVVGVSRIILVGFGVLLLIIGGVIITITKLYVKATPSMGFIRTGLRGKRVIVDGGALVIPAVHEVAWVTFETIIVRVPKKGVDALLTADNLRADVESEFFIKIKKEAGDIETACAALGEGSLTTEKATQLCQTTCESALREVAVQMTLAELNANRGDFKTKVSEFTQNELKAKGFTLDSVAVPKLDQTPQNVERAESNIFDAQGARAITEIVTAQSVLRNKMIKDSELAIKQQNVENAKLTLAQDTEQAKYIAEQDLEQAQAKALSVQGAATFAAEQERLSKLAETAKEQAVDLANVEREKAVDVAKQGKEQAAQVAEVEKDRALEIARRDKQIALANKEKDRADAEAEQLAAEALKEKNKQAVETVTVTETAEREKQKAIIAKQAESESKKLEANMLADTEAYKTVTVANADQQAAENKAEAIKITAEANKTSKVLAAEGLRAEQMVPVEVQRERVAVEREELANKAEFSDISKALTVELAKIEMEKDVRIAFAGAMGTMMSSSKMTIWGDPDTVVKMSKMFTEGQGMGSLMSGVTEATPDMVQQLVAKAVQSLADGIGGVAGKVTSK